MQTDEIYSLACCILKEEDANEALLRSFCKTAQAEWTARLRKDVRETDCGKNLICAAALTAVGHYAAAASVRELDGIRAFCAADLKIERGDTDAVCQGLFRQAERMMAPFCASGFSFRGVRG